MPRLAPTAPAIDGFTWTIQLHHADAPATILDAEAITPSDLADCRAEVGWGIMRMGNPTVAVTALETRMAPLRDDAGDRCIGFTIEASAPTGTVHRRVFGPDALEPVAWRGARRLLADGTLTAADHYTYRLHAEPAPGAAAVEPDGGHHRGRHGVRVVAGTPPSAMPHVEQPLAPLLARARGVDHPADDERHVVLFTEDALAAAERLSRKGADLDPVIETGCVLVGMLGACPESGEMFVAIVDALEATAVDSTEFSLSYSSATWARIQAVMRAKQAHAATAAQRIVGQAHGHPFKPGEPCAACATAAVCTSSSAFLSIDDLIWCGAVFSGEPWQASMVWGVNARGEGTSAFYGMHAGRLRRRGYHVIDDFPH